VADRYALKRQLGAGAMGVVWLATDERLQRKVAVKVLAESWIDSGSTRTRFEREARSVAQLRSPHIVEVYDYGIERDKPFIVMELLDGEELSARLKKRRRLRMDEVGTLVLQTSRALHVAHEAGVIHRDLKPGNIMLDKSTGEEMVKVLDFGVAKRTADGRTDVTKDGMLIGTPQYMAPEQARSVRDLDARADLWSLGVIVYRCLTGKLPFRAKTVVEMVVELCTADFPPATEICPDLPPLVDRFFERALAKDREERFQTARELAGAYFRMLKRVAPPKQIGTDTGQFLAMTDSGQFLAMQDEAGEPMDDASPMSDSSPSFPSDSGSFSLSESNPLAVPVAAAGSHPSLPEPGVTQSQARSVSDLFDGDSVGRASQPSATGTTGAQAGTSISTQIGMVDDISEESEAPRGRSKLLAAVVAVGALVLAGAGFFALGGPAPETSSAGAPVESAAKRTPEAPRDPSPTPPPTVADTATETSAPSTTAEPAEEPAPSASASAKPVAAKPTRRPPTTRRPTPPPKEPKPPPPGGDEDLLTDRH
jgi:serine/threonine-protein kinase